MNIILIQEYGKLLADCLIIAIETIGLVKFLDNFLYPKRDLSLREKCGMELIVCITCSYINSAWVHDTVTAVCNLFFMALSLTQLCYDIILHGTGKFIQKLFKMQDDE